MTNPILFGKNDKIALPGLNACFNPLADMDLWYTHSSYDRYYSEHGFAYPLQGANPLDIVLEGDFITVQGVSNIEVIYHYLLINHQGKLWHTQVHHLVDGTRHIAQRYIDPDHNGWWVLNTPYDQMTQNILLGYLSTNPSDKAIKNHIFKHHRTATVNFFSIKDITKTLQERFPKKKKYSTQDLDNLIERVSRAKAK